jgi:hypothetical protein
MSAWYEAPMSDVHPTEEFRPIPDFPGYQISNLGNIRSCWKRGDSGELGAIWRPLHPAVCNGGRYYLVTLTRDHTGFKRTLHSLVAEAFLGPRQPGMCVCHNNNDGLDNRLSNLRYDTAKSNASDRLAAGTENRGSRNGRAKLTEADVTDIRRRLAAGEKQKDIAALYHIRQETVSFIKTGRYWSHLAE